MPADGGHYLAHEQLVRRRRRDGDRRPGDVLSNPLLVNAGGWSAVDYKLTDTSPLRTAGTTEAAVTKDHWGTSRTAPYSIGAHEQ